MCNIPVEVDNDEKIIRAIKTPYHFDNEKGTIKPAAFRSPNDEVSVMRHQYLGSDRCKAKALEVVRGKPTESYIGLAAVKVKAVRDSGSKVIDSREEYCGHAHISHGFSVQKDEPTYSKLSMELNQRLRKLINDNVKFHRDPQPENPIWIGEEI